MEKINKSYFPEDILDFLILLDKYSVKYVIVGGQASIYYGHARLTGDIDIFYGRSKSNAKKLYKVLYEYWGGNIPLVSNQKELEKPGMVFQFGVPPNRIDLINDIGDISFQQTWNTKETAAIDQNNNNIEIYFISLDLLIKNKEQVKRAKDLDDLKFLLKVQMKKNN